MKTLGIIIVIIIIALAGWYLYRTQYQEFPLASPPASNTQSSGDLLPAPSEEKIVTVDINGSGFMPAEVRIKVGDTVKFINKDTKKRWPASGPHPQHTTCPGFDAKPGINPGESYSHTFTDAKTCPMHDHLNPTQFGKIIVE